MGAQSDERSPQPAFGLRLISFLLLTTLPATAALAQPIGLGPDFPVGLADPDTFEDVQRTRSVSRAADGTFVVVWERGAAAGQRPGIFAQLYDSVANPIGTEFRVSGESQYTGNLQSKLPAVAHTTNDEFVVVWAGQPEDESSTYQQILGKRHDAGGNAIGTEFQVGTATPDFGTGPDVAAIGDGRFAVVWPGRVNLASYAHMAVGQRIAADGSKLGTEFIANTFTEGDVAEPQVGSRGDGSFVVVWTGAAYNGPAPDGADAGVFGQRFGTDGSRAGAEFQVNTFTTYSQDSPDLAVRPDGSFVVVWRTQYGDDFEPPGQPEIFDDSITMRRYDAAGEPLGDEVHINTYLTADQISPAIAMDDNGSFVVVWESHSNYYAMDNRDDGAGLFGRCFGPGGTGPTQEFHVNTYTTGRERDASIASSGPGGFVVVWDTGESYSGGGDVRARRFNVLECPSSGTTTTTTTTTTLPGGGGPLSGSKTDNGHVWSDDPLIPYEISVTNDDDVPADVVITETVPARTTFSAGDSTQGWQCTPDDSAGSTCTLTVEGLAAGATEVVSFASRVEDGTTPFWTVYNEAEASADVPDAIAAGPGDRANGGSGIMVSALSAFLECLAATTSGNCDLCCAVICGAGLALSSIVGGEPTALVDDESELFPLFRLRDQVLAGRRGGDRFVDLYYEHSAEVFTAVMSDPGIIDDAVALIDLMMPNFEALADGNGSTVVITQAQADAIKAFLDRLRAAAPDALRFAIDRERARIEREPWAGLTMDEAVEQLDLLSCEGFEDALFCGEITGDCRITASDALAVLRIAVGTIASVAEADLDGSGSVTASDALQTLRIAVGTQANVTTCND